MDSIGKSGPFKDPRLVICKSPDDLKGDDTALREPLLLAKNAENARQKVLLEVCKH